MNRIIYLSVSIMFSMIITFDVHAQNAEELLFEKEAFVPSISIVKRPPLRMDSLRLMETQDVKRYEAIFALQEQGRWVKADDLIGRLNDLRLMGHVLKQRYLHPTSYRSQYEELRAWLEFYNDHAGAEEIYRLAKARKPAAEAAPKKPKVKKGLQGGAPSFSRQASDLAQKSGLSAAQKARVKGLQVSIMRDLRTKGAATKSLQRLQSAEAKQILSTEQIDALKGEIANTYYYLNRPVKAYNVASEAANRSGVKASLAAWIAGLSSWKNKEYENSAHYFSIAASSKSTSDWFISAAAFWASRAYLRIRKPQEVNKWLLVAAKEPRTFYGLIARRALGMSLDDLRWNLPKLTNRDIELIKSYPAGFRSFLLLQAGQRVLAEQELMQIHPRNNPDIERALLAFAAHHHLPAILLKVSTALQNPKGGRYYDGALYPLGNWVNQDDFQVDTALIHGFIRQESRFDPFAKSGSNATGLMQVLPTTASFVTGKSYTGNNVYKLFNPKENISVGKQYIHRLFEQKKIDKDLFKMAVAYNAGPGNLSRWWRELDHQNDPLFFIESIPVAETRNFVERVMTNYWIYRIRLGQPFPSLDAVVRGEWPVYKTLDYYENIREEYVSIYFISCLLRSLKEVIKKDSFIYSAIFINKNYLGEKIV